MRNLISAILVCLVLASVGCERRPLFEPEDTAELKVRIVTDGIHNVTCDIYNPDLERPAITSDVMRVLFYAPEGKPILSQGFIASKTIDENGYEVFRGPLSLSAGNYRLLSYNFDLDVTRIDNENDYDKIRATTLEVPQYFYSRFGSRADDLGLIYYAPDHLFVAREPELRVGSHQGVEVIELDATTVVDTYYVQIRISGVGNMAQNASAQAVLTGMASSNCFGPNIRCDNQTASLYFEMKRGVDPHADEGETSDVLCAVFNTFGKLEDVPSQMHVTLSVLTRDGETHQKVIDMAPIFESEDARERHWLLIDEVWEIPTPIAPDGGGGFAPDVEDWGDIEETIPIGPRN
jgi:hypothetical protein